MNEFRHYPADSSESASVLDQKVKLFKEFARLADSAEGHDRHEWDRRHDDDEALRHGWTPPGSRCA